MSEMRWAIGLMSGTSLDGIDAAIIRTDGEKVEEMGASLMSEYDSEFRAQLADVTLNQKNVPAIEQELTLRHATVVNQLLMQAGMSAAQIDVIGFHGQTILHQPDNRLTWQIGSGALLAQQTGIDVVCDFRRADVAAGGQGAPLVPLFHEALVRAHTLPVAIVNIGGIANVTYIGRNEQGESEVIAFDTGPGNTLLNQWIYKHTSHAFDVNGDNAKAGQIDVHILSDYLANPFFAAPPPKSLDRNDFSIEVLGDMRLEDGAATLTAFTCAAIERAQDYMPQKPRQWLATGGGRLNNAIMDSLKQRLGNVQTVEAYGLDGDMLEAQAFAYLAVRSLLRLPLSLPTTTGVPHAVVGGAFYPAGKRDERLALPDDW